MRQILHRKERQPGNALPHKPLIYKRKSDQSARFSTKSTITPSYEAVEELQQFFLALGIGLVEYDQQPAQPEVGRAYRGDVFQQFVSLIPHTRWIKQPGHCKIAGHDVFAWCDGKEIRISIGANYSVTEENVSAAQAVEEALVAAPLRPKDPPRDTQHCICPKYYPAYFEG